MDETSTNQNSSQTLTTTLPTSTATQTLPENDTFAEKSQVFSTPTLTNSIPTSVSHSTANKSKATNSAVFNSTNTNSRAKTTKHSTATFNLTLSTNHETLTTLKTTTHYPKETAVGNFELNEAHQPLIPVEISTVTVNVTYGWPRQMVNSTTVVNRNITTTNLTTTTSSTEPSSPRRAVVEYKTWIWITAALTLIVLLVCLTLYLLRARIWKNYYDSLGYDKGHLGGKKTSKPVPSDSTELASLKTYEYYFAYENPYEEFNFYLTSRKNLNEDGDTIRRSAVKLAVGAGSSPQPSGKFRIPPSPSTTPKAHDYGEDEDDSETGDDDDQLMDDQLEEGTPSPENKMSKDVKSRNSSAKSSATIAIKEAKKGPATLQLPKPAQVPKQAKPMATITAKPSSTVQSKKGSDKKSKIK